MKILVTGASGFVGRHLVASLRRDGKSVAALARGGARSDDRETVAGPADLAEIDRWTGWPDGISSIVHLAALNPTRRQAATDGELFHANVEATAALARRARAEGVGRIVFLSTANVHAPGPAIVRETDPLRPQSPYALSKAEGEAAFWQALAGGGTHGCVLRPAPVYGRGGRGNVAALVKLARLPVPLPIEDLGGARSLLAVDHLVQAIALCLSADAAAGETFLVADDGALDPAGVVRALRGGWNRTPRLSRLPAVVRRAAQRRLGGPMARFVLDATKLAEATAWRPADSSEVRLARMAADGDL